MITVEKITLTSNCQCYDCTNADCSTLTISEDYEPECSECGQATKPASNCDGICYESERDYLENEVFANWLMKVGNPTWLKVSGKNVGWRNLSGYDKVLSNFGTLFDYLTFNGDWTLTFTCNGAEFHVRRSSHDEPTGASYIIEPLKTLSTSMSIDEAVEKNLVDEYGCHKGCGEYFYDCNCTQED